MKWVKVAIGAVIAISVVPIIATSVYNITKETVKSETVTFEILTENTVTSGTFDLFVSGKEPDISYSIIDIYINDNRIGDLKSYDKAGYLWDTDTNSITVTEYEYIDSILILLMEDDTFLGEDYTFEIGDTVEIVFEVPQQPQLTGVSTRLILLAPLIFVAGVVSYLFVKTKTKEE